MYGHEPGGGLLGGGHPPTISHERRAPGRTTGPGTKGRSFQAGDPVGERLGRVGAERGMLLMLCDQCALERCRAEGEIGAARPTGTVAGVRVGCFSDFYAALAGDPPDRVITL
jgi:hypothetical protein